MSLPILFIDNNSELKELEKINPILKKSPLILISEPSPYPYEIDYTSLGGIMRDEQVEIFNICTNFYN